MFFVTDKDVEAVVDVDALPAIGTANDATADTAATPAIEAAKLFVLLSAADVATELATDVARVAALFSTPETVADVDALPASGTASEATAVTVATSVIDAAKLSVLLNAPDVTAELAMDIARFLETPSKPEIVAVADALPASVAVSDATAVTVATSVIDAERLSVLLRLPDEVATTEIDAARFLSSERATTTTPDVDMLDASDTDLDKFADTVAEAFTLLVSECNTPSSFRRA
jgi:hypothetical protein